MYLQNLLSHYYGIIYYLQYKITPMMYDSQEGEFIDCPSLGFPIFSQHICLSTNAIY